MGLREKLKILIRAQLLSSPLGVPLDLFLKDYEMLNGSKLDYKGLGYANEVEFLKDIDDVVEVSIVNNVTMLKGRADSSTQHLDTLVKEQRESQTGITVAVKAKQNQSATIQQQPQPVSITLL